MHYKLTLIRSSYAAYKSHEVWNNEDEKEESILRDVQDDLGGIKTTRYEQEQDENLFEQQSHLISKHSKG